MGSASSSRSLTLRLMASQSRMSTPPSLSRYSRRYHWPASRTYSTSHSWQPCSCTTGSASSQTTSVIFFKARPPVFNKSKMPNKKSGQSSPLPVNTLLTRLAYHKSAGNASIFPQKAGRNGGFDKKIPAERGKSAPARRKIQGHARFFSRPSRQASKNTARSTSTTVAPTGVLSR